MTEAFLCEGARTPVGRYGGSLAAVRPDDLLAHAIRAALAKAPGLDGRAIDEVYAGCANQAGEDNRNVARMALLLAGLALGVCIALPIVPVNSALWPRVAALNGDFVEEIGWPELVSQVAGIYDARRSAGETNIAIITANYGEAGAINLFGPAFHLPPARSGINSFWARGYGDVPPDVVIVVGFSRERAERFFAECEPAGRVTNRFGVKNEETADNPEIFICRRPRLPWPELWQKLRSFG